MGLYDAMKQADLQQAMRERDLPLAGGMSNTAMITALEQHDALTAEALLGDDGPALDMPAPAPAETPADTPAPASVAPPAAPVAPVAAAAEPETPPAPPREHTKTFPCQGELATEMHSYFQMATHQEALALGLNPHSPAVAHRTGWAIVDGVRHAVYKVPLRRR